MDGQKKLHSVFEAAVNMGVGFMLSVMVQIFITKLYHLDLHIQQNIEIVAIFTVVSFIRSYVLRRIFNKITIAVRGKDVTSKNR